MLGTALFAFPFSVARCSGEASLNSSATALDAWSLAVLFIYAFIAKNWPTIDGMARAEANFEPFINGMLTTLSGQQIPGAVLASRKM